MAAKFGAYTWVTFQDEAGVVRFYRATGVTDTVKGTQYVDDTGVTHWLATRSSPAEANSVHYPNGTPFAAYVRPTGVLQRMQTITTPNY